MYDELSGEATIFDFDEIANLLLEQGQEASPAELHGCLSGLLAAGATPEPEVGLDALGQALDLVLHGELADQMMQLYRVTAAALEDEEFDFHPLMPDDDVDIAVRTAALASWCRGFLSGFAHVTAGTDKGGSPLSTDSSEILRDFAAICEAAVDEDDEEDESEGAYMELIEFARFAALNVYMDSRSAVEQKDFPPGGDQPAH
jgi:hypothetical protein